MIDPFANAIFHDGSFHISVTRKDTSEANFFIRAARTFNERIRQKVLAFDMTLGILKHVLF